MGGNMQFLRCTVEMREINIGETSGEQQQKKGQHEQYMERKIVDGGGLMATMQPKPGESIELKTDSLVVYQANSCLSKLHHAPERKQSWCLADKESVSGEFP